MANLNRSQLAALWVQAGGDPKLAGTMAAIALAESGGNPGALNPNDNNGKQSSFGLWQISNGTHTAPSTAWADALTNAQLAVAKYQSQGLGAWGTWVSGAWMKYIGPIDKNLGSLNLGGSQNQNVLTGGGLGSGGVLNATGGTGDINQAAQQAAGNAVAARTGDLSFGDSVKYLLIDAGLVLAALLLLAIGLLGITKKENLLPHA